MSLDYKSIGKRIRLIRHRRRLSQAMLSELIDKTPSYISYIENGFKSMSLETFVLIANALRVSPTQLLIEQLTCTEIYASNRQAGIPTNLLLDLIHAADHAKFQAAAGGRIRDVVVQSHMVDCPSADVHELSLIHI